MNTDILEEAADVLEFVTHSLIMILGDEYESYVDSCVVSGMQYTLYHVQGRIREVIRLTNEERKKRTV